MIKLFYLIWLNFILFIYFIVINSHVSKSSVTPSTSAAHSVSASYVRTLHSIFAPAIAGLPYLLQLIFHFSRSNPLDATRKQIAGAPLSIMTVAGWSEPPLLLVLRPASAAQDPSHQLLLSRLARASSSSAGWNPTPAEAIDLLPTSCRTITLFRTTNGWKQSSRSLPAKPTATLHGPFSLDLLYLRARPVHGQLGQDLWNIMHFKSKFQTIWNLFIN